MILVVGVAVAVGVAVIAMDCEVCDSTIYSILFAQATCEVWPLLYLLVIVLLRERFTTSLRTPVHPLVFTCFFLTGQHRGVLEKP